MTTTPLRWSTSSYSDGAGGNCVEVAHAPGAVHVRDSKDTTITPLTLSPAAWADFLAAAETRVGV
ncbi:DUF397 domain-containing protein [Streptomyces thermolilacinus]|uniref:DUF397 domain-containing protein n=1 Tax=Streptomyces thermolilacinus SPC6 TaxID=1306406 RepID=A0A1D3DV83_9ACTN|nr:DUF397 domain-containing protein [Streptomyces thermolilacinus]OEJ96209.1 DUF397 domain-containing protein [Streptomyces thermolilacinus SPC6]